MPTVSIPLTQGKVAVIDEGDLPIVASHSWYAVRSRNVWYAVSSYGRKTVYMHRLLLGFPNGQIDHRDGDGLNNTRQNLREATASQNGANKVSCGVSGFKGIWRHPLRGTWRADVKKGGRRVFMSQTFHDPESAAKAYDEAARRIHGEFAILNFPNEGERGIKKVNT